MGAKKINKTVFLRRSKTSINLRRDLERKFERNSATQFSNVILTGAFSQGKKSFWRDFNWLRIRWKTHRDVGVKCPFSRRKTNGEKCSWMRVHVGLVNLEVVKTAVIVCSRWAHSTLESFVLFWREDTDCLSYWFVKRKNCSNIEQTQIHSSFLSASHYETVRCPGPIDVSSSDWQRRKERIHPSGKLRGSLEQITADNVD